MKKLIVLCAVLATLLPSAYAQRRDVKAIEVEIGGGMTFGAAQLSSAGFDKTKAGETGFIELRYNFIYLPIDIGLHAGGTVFGREQASGEKLNFSSGNFMVTADYNRRRTSNCMWFAGLGVGLASLGNSAKTEYMEDGGYTDNGSGSSLCFMPRIGVELFHHLRLTAAYTLEERANRHFLLSLGIVIGGGRK